MPFLLATMGNQKGQRSGDRGEGVMEKEEIVIELIEEALDRFGVDAVPREVVEYMADCAIVCETYDGLRGDLKNALADYMVSDDKLTAITNAAIAARCAANGQIY